MIFRVKNLRLRTIIGINDWERVTPQDIVINIEAEFDGERAAQTDEIADTVNYRDVAKRVIEHVESRHYGLIEALAHKLLDIVMEDPRVRRAGVEIDKPGAIRYAESVSITATAERAP